MDKKSSFTQRNPVTLSGNVGKRMRSFRLAKGWTQQELAERFGVAVSTLKLMESKGQGSFLRLIHIAIALGVDGEIRDLFSDQTSAESIEALKRAERKRAPRRNRKGADDGT